MSLVSGSRVNKTMNFTFDRKLNTGDSTDYVLLFFIFITIG